MSETCACGRLPDPQGFPFWDKAMVMTRYDGTHAAGQCQIGQLVTVDRPEQDELLRRIEAAMELLESEIRYERSLGRHLSLTQISDALRGES